jgi:cytochrome c1
MKPRRLQSAVSFSMMFSMVALSVDGCGGPVPDAPAPARARREAERYTLLRRPIKRHFRRGAGAAEA